MEAFIDLDINDSDTECEEVFFGPITKREITSKLKHYNLLNQDLLEPLKSLNDNDVLDDSLIKYYFENSFPKCRISDNENWKSRLKNSTSCKNKEDVVELPATSEICKNSLEHVKQDLSIEVCTHKVGVHNQRTAEIDKTDNVRDLKVDDNLETIKPASSKELECSSNEKYELVSIGSSPNSSDISFYSKTSNSSFNCTLDEMENFLERGGNYIKTGSSEEIDEKENIPIYSNRVEQNDNQEFIFPRPKTPFKDVSKKSQNLRNIVSPVAMYIKGNPEVPLIQKVSVNAVRVGTFREMPSKVEVFSGGVRTNCNLPTRSYRPATKTALLSQEEEIALPESIRRLMHGSTPLVIKHLTKVPESCDDVQDGV